MYLVTSHHWFQEPASAVWCRNCWDIEDNIFIPAHLAKHEVQARPAHEASNTTATGRDSSGMNSISQKRSETSVNKKLSPGLQQRPRLNSNKTNHRNTALCPQLKEYLALSYMEGSCYRTPWLDLIKYFHLRSCWIYSILWEIIRQRGTISIILCFGASPPVGC